MHISGFFICFSLTPFPPPPCCQASPKPTVTGPSGPLRDLSGTGGGGWSYISTPHWTTDGGRWGLQGRKSSLPPCMLSALFYLALPRHRGSFRFLGALPWPKPDFTSGILVWEVRTLIITVTPQPSKGTPGDHVTLFLSLPLLISPRPLPRFEGLGQRNTISQGVWPQTPL